jgi:hypothetical protein
MTDTMNNGRVDVMSSYPNEAMMQGPPWSTMAIAHGPRTTDDFQRDAIRSIHVPDGLSELYFSQTNVDAVQQGIRYGVFKQTGKTIGEQSVTELKIVMRSIYLQYARHRAGEVLQETRELNKRVLDFCVKQIVDEIGIYEHYKADISRLPEPLARSTNVSSAGTRELPAHQF